jgi:hypothetical protein
MMHGMGALQSGGTTLPAAGVGMAAKAYADKATSGNVEALAQIIGNYGMNPATKNAVQRLSQAERDTLSRLINAYGVTQSVEPTAP